MSKDLSIFFSPITKILKRNIYETVNPSKSDPYSYRSVLRKKIIKKSILHGFVDNHHIIPQQFKNHDIIHRVKFNIDFSYNIAILPNAKFRHHKVYHDFPDVLIHERSHVFYSNYVKQNLNEMMTVVDEDELKLEFWLFTEHLKHSMYHKTDVPWN